MAKNNMLRKVQKMQSEMLKMQESLADETVEATSGGGAVKVVVNGRQEMVSISITKEAVDPEDVETLEDLVLTAVNEALKNSQDVAEGKLRSVTGNINIPGLF